MLPVLQVLQVLPGIARYCPGTARYCQVLPGIARYCQVLPGIVPLRPPRHRGMRVGVSGGANTAVPSQSDARRGTERGPRRVGKTPFVGQAALDASVLVPTDYTDCQANTSTGLRGRSDPT